MALFKHLNLMLVIDHGSRGGNAFVMSIFDQHPEVLCCPYILYLYSTLISHFGDETIYESDAALAFIEKHHYIGTLYHDLNPTNENLLKVIGADQKAKFDRPLFRDHLKKRIQEQYSVSRRSLIEFIFEAYAIAAQRDPQRVKYILLSDAISLKEESPLKPYSCRSILAAHHDFPDFQLISLTRDPRAQFCSCRHQSINLNGNAYGVKEGNFLMRMKELLSLKFYPENFAFLFWTLYAIQTFQSISTLRKNFQTQCYLLRNEDLNLNFVPTMQKFCNYFQLSILPTWLDADYAPTMMGKPWKGTGAFIKSKYPEGTNFKLPVESSGEKTNLNAPNPYVTQRWRTQLLKSETIITSYLFREELKADFYDLNTVSPPKVFSFLKNLIFLTRGESPRLNSSAWEKTIYFATSPFFYSAHRLALLIGMVLIQKNRTKVFPPKPQTETP